MQRTNRKQVVYAAKADFNYNKLQAVICMGLSAAITISTIAWAVKFFG